MSKVGAFILTSLCGASFFGMIGAFAILKYPLSEEFDFDESYLGSLDGFSQIGTLIANIWLVFAIIKKPKKLFFYLNSIQAILFLGMILGLILPKNLISMYFVILLTLFGITKSVCFIPNLVFAQYFDQNSEKIYFSIWLAILWLGDPAAILFYDFVTQNFNWSWQTFLITNCSISIILSVLWQLSLKQVPIGNSSEEQKSIWEQIADKLKQTRKILSIPYYVAFIIEDALISTFYYNILLWFPYYFTMQQFSSPQLISIAYPVMCIIGSFIFQGVVNQFQRCAGLMSSICLGMSTIISLAMFYYSFSEADSGKVLLFIILSGAQGILVGGPCARLAQHDLVQITEGNPQDIYIILVIYTLVKCVLSTITLYLIGYCLERDHSSMFLILLVNMFLCFASDFIMKFFTPDKISAQQHN